MRQISAALLAVALGFSLALAYSSGGPTQRSFAPFQGSCSASDCHNSYAVDLDSTRLEVDIPLDFYATDTLDIHIRLIDPGQQRWGFQFLALNRFGEPTGEYILVDPARTQVLPDTGNQVYVSHTLAGTDAGSIDSTTGWHIRWVPPPEPASRMVFYVAAVAADGDGTAAGDRVWLAQPTNFGYYLCPEMISGDVNLDGVITAADLIAVVNYVFKGGAEPLPCAGNGDVDCNGSVTAADIIYLVGHVFKGAAGPCDICNSPSAMNEDCW